MGLDKWAIEGDEEKYALSEESAAGCVKELLKFYRIKPDKIDKKIAPNISQTLETLQEAYRLGTLENARNEDGGIMVVQTVKGRKDGKDTITYREPAGKDKRVMDNYEPTEYYQRMQALLGKLSGLGPDIIGELKRDDLRVAEALALVFFMG